MKSIIFALCFFAIATDNVRGQELSCYSCSGKESDCPLNPTSSILPFIPIQTCSSVLKTVCAKHSIKLPGGERFNFRGCVPSYVGGVDTASADFCSFVKGLYQPLLDDDLIDTFTCTTCNTINCNT